MRRNILFSLFPFLLFGCAEVPVKSGNIDATPEKILPIDWRNAIRAESFSKTDEGCWISPVITAPFAFEELIYSWSIRLKKGEAFRIYLKVAFTPGDETDWLYAGFWGAPVEMATGREKPKFDRGIVDMDWLKLKTKAVTYQFRIESAGETPLDSIPTLTVVCTDNHPTEELFSRYFPAPLKEQIPGRAFDIPLRRQMDSQGNATPSRCQSAALASAMEYFGKSVNLEDIIDYIHDPEYDYPGLWPRVIGAAGEFGFDGYIDRFREWDSVRKALSEHKILLTSIRMAEGDCKAPPYKKMGNHIIVLNGVTDDGRVVVTDSALGKSGKGYLCQWLQEDFEKIWMRTKGGVTMVICPPKGAEEKLVENLPPFPLEREHLVGDDH
ncbi:C39 family peptidase [Candidatus Sumerlaeota bacterium]|nr:C39 family peptidase [Candidatus Sumerlaeota bacterium]